ncbi:hypothetical protein SCOCK_240075 [Actinacidiphila cocklensis]|uniref:Uncharacterized protein n=1 Tax=Actinacidiphila cocklensis TaxID=887465 RepID=A0A9W4DPW8_9ACTN|nr:hypothetical protein SCOCK_240075 [Actinacidiphila cocklensis]
MPRGCIASASDSLAENVLSL